MRKVNNEESIIQGNEKKDEFGSAMSSSEISKPWQPLASVFSK